MISRSIVPALLTLIVLFVSACTTAPDPVVVVPTLALLPTTTPAPTQTLIAPTLIPPSVTPSVTATDTPTRIPTDTTIPTLTDTTAPTAAPAETDTPTAIPPIHINAADLNPLPQGAIPTPLIPARTLRALPQTPTATATETPAVDPTPIHTGTPGMPLMPAVWGDASITITDNRLVNLRAAPAHDAPPLEALASGTNVFLIGRSWDDEWLQVRLLDGREGWIYNLYLVVWIDPNRLIVTHLRPTEPPLARVALDTFALGGHVMNLNSNAFNTARSAGMGWIKYQHRYFVGQRPQEVEPLIRMVHNAGFRLVLGVVGEPGQIANGFESFTASYAEFVGGVAALGVDALEIWNEPNIDREWPRGMIHGEMYTRLLAASYNAIKARNPNTIVISAAPAPTGFFGPAGCGEGGCNDDIYLKQMAFAGAMNYLDCVGMHHNDGILSPLQTSGDPRGDHPTYYLSRLIGRVPSEFNSYPICFTEIGYLSPEGYGGLPGNFAWAQRTTASQQAQWLAEAVDVLRSSGRVQMMIVWNIDFTVYNANDPMAGYAILRPGGVCLACELLAARR